MCVKLVPGTLSCLAPGVSAFVVYSEKQNNPTLTLPTKVPSGSLGRIGSLKGTSDKSLFPMALGSYGHRITHQLRPINMNGRSILSETSTLTLPTKVPSGSLGRIGSLKGTSDKSLFPMALGSYGHRITHQLRPINMNGRSILSETSTFIRSKGWLGQIVARHVTHPGSRIPAPSPQITAINLHDGKWKSPPSSVAAAITILRNVTPARCRYSVSRDPNPCSAGT